MLLTAEQRIIKKMTEDTCLVKIQIGSPGRNQKMDRLAKETAKAKGIDVNSVNTTVVKLVNDNLDKWSKITAEARKYLGYRSAAYDDNGFRIVRVRFWPKIEQDLDEMRIKAFEARDRVLEEYEAIKESAQDRLGSEFEWANFPSKEELRETFKFDIQRDVVTDGSDVKIKHTTEFVKAFETEMNQKIERKAAEARAEGVDRIKSVLSQCVETLESYDGGKVEQEKIDAKIKEKNKLLWKRSKATAEEKVEAKAEIKELKEKRKKFRVRNNGSSINNVKEMVMVLDKFNVTGDESIEKAGEKIASIFDKYDAEEVKKDTKLRKKATSEAKGILEDLQNIELRVR